MGGPGGPGQLQLLGKKLRVSLYSFTHLLPETCACAFLHAVYKSGVKAGVSCGGGVCNAYDRH